MILYKIIGSLFEIPGIFILICFIMFLYYLKKEKRVRKFLLSILIIIYIISTGWFSRMLVYPLENKYPPFKLQGKEFSNDNGIILTLGGGIISNISENTNQLSDSSMQRIYQSYLMYKNLRYPIIVTGGKIEGTKNLPEAFVMKDTLIKMGVEPEDIFIEINARNTEENAKFASDIAKSLNKDKIYLVTSAVHLPRSMKIFEKYFEENLIPIPTDYQLSRTELSWYDFLPKMEFLKATASALHEYIGILYLMLKN
ncbi:YdcF family protein [Oceanotoga sp. DSM 15011]|jgi:uncharacterized SAM-binding protein YcdF (DUF218 family)|uniref:Uncharacterized SAM-binding protein YcdF (DUF218 family) n=1 Tax=Oceanotoga teriensis TaxID=515440 RepID=A0AA45C8X0_9BACT|nr:MULTISPECIES: YdcF family protein [Oceanotoga]MDN5342709.1 hypothetical protein [Oceanotoga sp.]PWJ96443.1 uncharacterized SAM-binding protein YcdF (DUF218 family) [Oceanotoga teriensis]UYP00383.1 YdcF family protein [Oceanotoga sp. DSM 15011]